MEKLHNIKGIFFDLGGTLIYPPSGSWMFSELAYRYFPKERLQEPGPQAAMSRASRELDGHHLLHTVEEEYEQFYGYYKAVAKALPELGLTGDDLRIVTEDKVYNKADNYRMFDSTLETLEAVRGRYRLGIISDTWPSIVPLLEYLGILKYFDCATFSFELGAFKPDRQMFLDALSKMGLPPEQTVFIDDNPKNLAGAAALGIVPVLISAAQWSPELDRGFGIDHIQAAGGAVPEADAPGFEFRRIDEISGLLELL